MYKSSMNNVPLKYSYDTINDQQISSLMPLNFRGVSGKGKICEVVGDVFDLITTLDIYVLLRPYVVEHNDKTDKRVMFNAISDDASGRITIKLRCRLNKVIMGSIDSTRWKITILLFNSIINKSGRDVTYSIINQNCNIYDIDISIEGESVNSIISNYDYPDSSPVLRKKSTRRRTRTCPEHLDK